MNGTCVSYIFFIYDAFIVPIINKLNGCMCYEVKFMSLDISDLNFCVTSFVCLWYNFLIYYFYLLKILSIVFTMLEYRGDPTQILRFETLNNVGALKG